jgi:pyrroloquinoline-quinone synthase
MAIVHVLEQDAEKKSLLKHPFYQAWNEGKLPKHALVEYAKQYYHFTENFPRFVAGVYSTCKDVKVRKEMLKNLQEEELGSDGKSHADLWLQFAQALGVSSEDTKTSLQHEKTQGLLNTFEGITKKTFLQGVACLLAYEIQVPAIAETKKKGLQSFYGITNPEGVAFFDEHMHVDKEHMQVWKNILAQARPEELAGIRESFNQSLQAQWEFLDGCMEVC